MNLVILIVVPVLFFLMVVVYNRVFLKFKIQQFIRTEKERQEGLKKIRKEMARDFHDEMGNHMASIIAMVNILSLKLNSGDEQVQRVLKKIERSSKELFQGTREFMWTMDPDHDKLTEVLIYLRDYGVNFFQNTHLDFEVGKELMAGLGSIVLPTGYSRHIIAVFKEAMTNCLKHSEAEKVIMSTFTDKNSFTIKISDNGIGLRGKMGRGLHNMQTRALKINAILRCKNNVEGFSVELKFNHIKMGNH